MTAQQPKGPDDLADELLARMVEAIPGGALPHQVASDGVKITLQALIAKVYADTPDDPLPTICRLLVAMKGPASFINHDAVDAMEDAMQDFDRIAEEVMKGTARQIDDYREQLPPEDERYP